MQTVQTNNPNALLASLLAPTAGAQAASGASLRPGSAQAADAFSRQLAEQREARRREADPAPAPAPAAPRAANPPAPPAPPAPRTAQAQERAGRSERTERGEPAARADGKERSERADESTARTDAPADEARPVERATQGEAKARDAAADEEDATTPSNGLPPGVIDPALQDMLARQAVSRDPKPLARGTAAIEPEGVAGLGRQKATAEAQAEALAGRGEAQDADAPIDPRAALDTRASAFAPAALTMAAGLSPRAAGAEAAAGATTSSPSIGALGALGATGATGGLAAPTRAGETAQAAVPTPVHSPEFKAALGLQVAVLARGGVQQAELTLNPAELGPVSVQIMLDGRHAQVNFGADLAQTRQLIESGMPELAAALRDAGFTLTGGGVAQHGRQRDGDGGARGDADTGGESGNGGEADAAAAPRRIVRVSDGRVDLYA